jgi:hypothetical protein
MNTEIIKAEAQQLDGFDAFSDEVEGGEERRPHQGAFLKFTNEGEWTANGEPMSTTREFVVVDIDRCEVKWGIDDGPPLERVFLAPGQRFHDIDKLNAETPRNEWRKGPDGQLRGPWQSQHIARLLDPKTMDRFSFPTSTVGGAICIRDLVDRTKWMRKFRGEPVYPLVTLADTFMNTRYGGRQRPHFEIVRFVTFGGPGEALQTITAKPELNTVEPPSVKEATGDEIQF